MTSGIGWACELRESKKGVFLPGQQGFTSSTVRPLIFTPVIPVILTSMVFQYYSQVKT
jgi:hypothetical protein